jgi:hypothetical protein
MTLVQPGLSCLDPASAAPYLADLGFTVSPDQLDRQSPACLLVAIRETPTLRHFDPETVEYWVTDDRHGARRRLTRATTLPIATDFSWGLIRIADRLHVTNEYLAFGGRMAAESVGDMVVAVFTSPAPVLRRGGHSQPWDLGADSLGAFFSRFMVAVDYSPGFEARAAQADPVTRYASFLADAVARYRTSPALRSDQPTLWVLLRAEEHRLRARYPSEWAAGERLRCEAIEWATFREPVVDPRAIGQLARSGQMARPPDGARHSVGEMRTAQPVETVPAGQEAHRAGGMK